MTLDQSAQALRISIREQRVQVICALVEGNSIRATCRMTGVAKNTVVKLLVMRAWRRPITMTGCAA